MRNKVITILFLLLLFGGTASSLILPDKYYSEQEKRTLKQFPAFSASTALSGKFGSDIETYLADQFPARDAWISLKTVAERASGKKESGGVYFAADGYLVGIETGFSAKQTAVNTEAIAELTEALAEEGIPLRVMLVPTAAQILSEKLPRFAPNANQQAVTDYLKEQGIPLVDVSDALSAHKEEYIYYKTDHHWTSLGAYYAYAAWKAEKEEQAEPLSAYTKEELCSNFRGTSYAKVNDPFAAYDTIDAYYKTLRREVSYNGGASASDSIYERKYLSGSDQYAVFFNSNQSLTVAKGGGEGRLLILKDSYANCFAQFCVDDYEETHLIDLRFFAGSVKKYAAENGITEVLILYNIPNFTSDTGIAGCAR